MRYARWTTAIALAIGVLVLRGRHSHEPSPIQAAVTASGFAIAHAGRAIDLDAQGAVVREQRLPQSDDVRVVGSSSGTAAVWLANRKIQFAILGDTAKPSTFGTNARRMCDGVASNDLRFGVGWLESDGRVWMVHGQLRAKSNDDDDDRAIAASDAAAEPSWCGIAAADNLIALIWRDAGRLFIDMCTTKRCASFPSQVGLDAAWKLLGVGCLRDGCVVAVRDGGGAAHLAFVTTRSRTAWSQPIAATSTVSIVGGGDRAFAVARTTDHGADVARIDRDGKSVPIWTDAAATSVPSLAWSGGRLLVAYQRNGELVHATIAMPR